MPIHPAVQDRHWLERGLANYWLARDDPRHCFEYTGSGNTLDATTPKVLRLILDSLPSWW